MDENLHDIDKLFRDPIEEHEDMPSARVWEAIDANLDKSNIVSIKKKYDNLKKIAVALLLLLLGAVVYEIQTTKTAEKNTAANTDKKGKTIRASDANNTVTANPEKNTNISPENQDRSWTDSSANNFTTNNAIKNTDDKTSTINNKNNNETGENDRAVGVNTGDKSGKVNKVNKVNGATVVDELNAISGGDKVNKVNKVNRSVVTDELNAANGVKEAGSISKVNTVNKVNKGKAVKSGKGNVQVDAATLASGNNKSGSKTRGSKTKMRVQNGTAALTDDITNVQANENNYNETAAELQQPENTGVQKLSASDNTNILKQITTARVSPDARLKNKIRMPGSFHLSITLFVSQQFSFNRMEDDHRDPGPLPRNGREQIKKEEQRQTASAAGVLVHIPLGKKWDLQSGFTYVSQFTTMQPKKIFAKMDTDGKVKYRFDCSSGYTYISLKTGAAATPAVGDSVVAAASTNTLKYVGIPLALSYTVNLGKFNIVPTFGTVANFLAKQQIETEITQPGSSEKQTINSIQGLKSSYFNAYTGIAFEYNLNKRIAFSVIPAGNFALSSINKDAAVKSYPNSFAVTGGVKIKL